MWPFRGRNRPARRTTALPSALREIGAKTPLRFSVTLADPRQAAQARQVLAGRLAAELTVQGDERLLQLASAFRPGDAAVLRPLHVLDRAGITVAGLALSGLVTEMTDDGLREVVHDWAVHSNTGPFRRRIELLAGPVLLDRCLAAGEKAERTQDPDAAAWWFAVRCVAFNTAGAERRVLDEAVSSGDIRAAGLVDAAYVRVQLARLCGLAIKAPAESVAQLLARRDRVAEPAARLAALLPAPLDAIVTDALCDLAERGGEAAHAALGALCNTAPTPGVREASDAALASDDANTRAAGLVLLARHWTDDARPVWRRFLASTSAPLRQTAENVIGDYGTEEDLPDAAAHLAKLIRTRQGISQSPPRGSSIVNLLIRHRTHPVARVALDDLTDRWTRLPDDLRTWLAEEHVSLVPTSGAADDEQADVMPEELLTWPPPSIQRDGSSFMLVFDEDGAHRPVRDRFEELAERHPSVEVLNGDREWLSVVIAAADPEALVRALWSSASESSHP